MMTKMKLALAMCGALAASAGGIALANGWHRGGRAAMLQKYDTNGNGKLDPQERAVMRADMKAKRQARRAKILAKYDTNGDGKLEPAERKVMIDDFATRRFEKIDANGDGVISLGEFKAFQESHAKRGRRWFHHGRFGHRRFRARAGAAAGVNGAGAPRNMR